MSVRRAQDERIEGTPDGNTAITEISDVPDAPTVSTITNTSFDGSVTVAATAGATGGTPTTFTITPTPTTSPATFTGASPVTVSGLSDGTSYTFTAAGVNSTATGPAGSASASTAIVTAGSFSSIATTTVGAGGTSTVTFSSIPSTYSHLQIRGITAGSGVQSTMRFNSDSATNYASHGILGDGTSATSGGSASQTGINSIAYLTNVSNVFVPFVIDIFDYANTNKYKTIRFTFGWEANTSGNYVTFNSGLWMSTSAIDTITISGNSGTIGQYSSYALYGVMA